VRVPKGLWLVLGAGALLRFALLPFLHPWDGNTFHNLFAQLAHGENPYRTLASLTLDARSHADAGWSPFYEYYAYPPLLIYLYWPLAHAAALFGPLATHFYAPGSESLVPNAWPLSFLLLYKLPIWIADFAVAWMLWRMTGKVWPVALWLLNPLVLLVSGAWMFDSIPAALTLGALWAYQKERVGLCGALLALGFAAKLYPVFLVPVFFLLLVWREDARAFRLVAVFAVVALALCAPFWPEVSQVFTFNSARQGGGLTLHQIPLSWLQLAREDQVTFRVLTSPVLGALTLVGGMGLAYWLLDRVRPGAPSAVLFALLAFFLATKLVNEQYVLWVLPFAILALAQPRPPQGARAAFHLLWAVPFAYALVHVPLPAFVPGADAWTRAILDHPDALSFAAALAAVAFVAVTLLSLRVFWPTREVAA